jgi:hypothetical protein
MRRENKKKIVRVSWKTLCYLHIVNTHGAKNITKERQCKYNVTLRRCRKITISVEKQKLLLPVSVCVCAGVGVSAQARVRVTFLIRHAQFYDIF